jgi:NAD(P)-dependent dehydrogenase (short-subunit alcohol dehydrogenase family)
MELQGRTALVTGAASGIGRSCALAFAREGADLVLADKDEAHLREVESLVSGIGRRCLAVHCDVASADEVRSLGERAWAEAGGVQIAMSNAGIGGSGPAHEVPLSLWRELLDVNLFGAIHVVHEIVPRMLASGRPGQVVLTASISALGVALPFMAPYAVAKAGLVALAESLRMELEPHHIGVTVVCPGLVATNIAAAQDNAWALRPEVLAEKGIRPEEVAAAVVDGIRANRLYVFTSSEDRLLSILKRAAPATFTRLLGRYGRSAKAMRELRGPRR